MCAGLQSTTSTICLWARRAQPAARIESVWKQRSPRREREAARRGTSWARASGARIAPCAPRGALRDGRRGPLRRPDAHEGGICSPDPPREPKLAGDNKKGRSKICFDLLKCGGAPSGSRTLDLGIKRTGTPSGGRAANLHTYMVAFSTAAAIWKPGGTGMRPIASQGRQARRRTSETFRLASSMRATSGLK